MSVFCIDDTGIKKSVNVTLTPDQTFFEQKYMHRVNLEVSMTLDLHKNKFNLNEHPII